MKITIFFWALISVSNLFAQDGKIIERKIFLLSKSDQDKIKQFDPNLSTQLKNVNFYKIVYLSDGLRVIAYSAEPKKKGKYPCIIDNRGGNRSLGQWDQLSVAYHLGRIATWGYVAIGSQYRGVDGGEGKEEFGGKDIDDVLNLVPLLAKIPNTDISKLGISGTSRGGMMTYLALKKTCQFKAAVVLSGAANAFSILKSRPEFDGLYNELIPNYKKNKNKELSDRTATLWADSMCKTTPLLIMQGSSDWRVPAEEAIELVQKLYQYKHPTRFILYEGADHGIREFNSEVFSETKRHFDYYLRDDKKWPSMEPHGG